MIGRFAPWLLLLALGVAAWWRFESVLEQRNDAQALTDQLAAELDAQLMRNAQLLGALEEREADLAAAERRISQRRDAARRLEVTDAETTSWADQSVPDAVRQWVRDLPAGTATGPDGAGLHAESAGRAGAGDQPQP